MSGGIGGRLRRIFGLIDNPSSDMLATLGPLPIPYQQNRPQWPTWDPAIASRDGFGKLALIYRAMNLISHASGTATLLVYNELTEEEIPDHDLRQLIRRPNPTIGESLFHGMIALKAMAAGFCVVEKERATDGSILNLWPLQSSWLKAVPRPDGTYDWRYLIPGYAEPFTLQAEDVIHFKWADTPDGSPYGMGPVEACFREAGLTNTMVDFLKAFFDHGAVPLVGLVPDTMPGQTLNQRRTDQLLEQFLIRHGGLAQSSVPMVMNGIKEIVRLGFDFNELAYVDLRDLNELGVAQAFGIPASVLPIRVGLEHSDSRANAESDEGKFYRQAVVPFWTRWDDTLTISLLEREFDGATQPITLSFDWSDVPAMQDDRNAKASWTMPAVLQGIMSVHTWHREMNLKPPQGPDYYVRNFAQVMVPVEDPLMLKVLPTIPDAPADASPEGQKALQSGRETFALPSGRVVGIGAARRYAAAGRARGSMDKISRAGQKRVAAFFSAQGKRIVPTVMRNLLEKSGEVERLVRDYQTVRHHEGLNGRSPQDLDQLTLDFIGELETLASDGVDWKAENAKLRKQLEAVHIASGKASFSDAKALYGINPGIAFDVANPQVKAVVDKLGRKVVDITETTRGQIAATVARGLDEGKTSKEIADSLYTMFDQTYQNRAWTVARTETTHAYGYANEVAFKESGVVDRAQLFDNPDHDEDYGAADGLTCAERDGFVCDLDDMMDHILADHPNGSVVGTPILEGEDAAE